MSDWEKFLRNVTVTSVSSAVPVRLECLSTDRYPHGTAASGSEGSMGLSSSLRCANQLRLERILTVRVLSDTPGTNSACATSSSCEISTAAVFSEDSSPMQLQQSASVSTRAGIA